MKHLSKIILFLSIVLVSNNVFSQGWTVNPADYNYNGQFTAIVFHGSTEVTTGTLGAFVGATCRGYVTGSFFPPSGKTVFTVICFSNAASGETMTLKYYDQTDGTYYDIKETVGFISDMTLGDAMSPLQFHTVPLVYSVTGGGSYCEGASALPVGLSDSEIGVTYSLLKGGTPTGTTVAGTGSSITFGNQTAGTYTVEGTNSGGTRTMTGNAVITENPLPSVPASNNGSGAGCTQITANWTASANSISYAIDVSTVISFATFVSGYENLDVGNVTSYNVSGLTAGTTYYYRVRGVNSCGSSGNSLTVTYATSAPPSQPGTISGLVTQCPGRTGQVYSISPVPGALTYTWTVPAGWNITSGGTTNSITVNTGSAGNNGDISVTAGNSCGTSLARTLGVTVDAIPTTPTITAGGPTTFCAGGSVTLTSSAGSTYLWSTGATTASINVTTAGSYTVQVTNASGCQSASSAATVVTVNTLPSTPTITAGGPTTFCTGGSVTLTSSAGTSYLWSTGATTASINVTTAGSYTVQVTNASGCQSASSAATAVTVNALPATPTITAGGPTTFCTGGSVTLTSSAGTSYLWSTGATTASINVTTAGSYTVQVTNANGCQSASSAATAVTVNTLPATPTITPGGPTTFCAGGSVTLTSSAGTTYLWSTGATTQSINVTAGGSFTVRVTNASGCQSAVSAATAVTVNTLPVVNAGTDATIPYGTSTALNATVTGTGPFTYSWTPSSQLVNATVEDPTTLNLTGTTVFTLTATSTATTCSNTDAVTITVSGGALSSVPTATPGTICAGASVQLSAVASGGSGSYTYSWTSLPAGFTSSLANPTVNPSVSTTYYVAVNDGFNTVNSQVGVTVNALPATPTITAGGPTTFCAGGSVTLTSSAGSTYLWSTGAITQSINVTTAGSYTVRVTNASGCQSASSAATAVTVNALPATPTITAGGPTTFCTGGSVTLTSSAGTSYLWSTGATTASINVTTAGSYTVQVTNASGCQSASSAATSVTVNALPSTPTITAGGPTTFCTGGSVTLISSAGTTYLWSTGATTASINVATAGSYTVRVTNANGCQSAVSAATVVTVNALPATPTITASGPTTFCTGGSVTLTSSAGSSYLWSTGATTASINVTTAGSYTVQVTNASGCQSASSAATAVTVNALPATPTITAGGPTTFCTGGSVTLTSSAGTSYLWSTGATTASINVTTAGSYTVQVTNANGCQSASSAATVVTVNALPATPTITPGGPTTFCAGGSVTLTSSAGTTYLWSTGATTQSINVTAGGSFTVRVTNASGCQSAVSAATAVTVNALPVVNAGTDATIPYGTSTALNATVTGTGPFTYSWTPSSQLVNATVEDPTTLNLTGTTVFTLTATSTATTCSNTDAVTITVSGGALSSVPTATPGTICAGASVQLSAVASGGSGSYTYSWTSLPAGFTSSLANPTVNPSVSTTYYVAVNDGFNTVNSQVGVTVNALPATPTITAGGPTTFCAGGSVTLTSSAGTSYLWSTGATTQSINVTTAGSYTVRVTNASGCQSASSAATAVTVNALPSTPTITASGPTTFCTGGSVTLTSSAGTTYLWSTGATTQSINVTAGGSFTVRVTNASGCQSAVSAATAVTVNTLPVVNAGTDATIPHGTSTTLNATVTGTGPFNYSWTPSSQLVNSSVEDPATVNLYSTTFFTLIATSTSTSCSSSDEVKITISGTALSSVPTATPGTICLGASVQLAAVASGGSGSYTYSWTSVPAGFTSALANPTVTPTVNTTYHVAVNDGYNTVNSQVGVTVNALPATPTITAGGPTTFCTGGSVTLTSSAGTTYLWSTGATTASINVTAAGSYTVRVTNSNGCQSASSAATVVTVNVLPATPTITADGPTTFCAGGSVTLTSSAGTTYLWSTGATTQSINVSSAGSYTVRVTNASGCQSAVSAATAVTINALPATPTITAGGPTTFCAGGSVTLTSSAGSTYLWSTGATTQSINVTTAGSYTVRVTNASGCQSASSAATVVTVNALPATPTITASGPTTFCTGGSVTLTSGAGTTYLWSTGATTQSINVTAGGSFTVRVTNASGCQSAVSAATAVTVNTLPVVNAGTDATIPHGTSTTLNATVTGTGPFNYSWTPSSQLVNSSVEDPATVNLYSTTFFTLIATSTSTSCSSSDEVKITISGTALSSVPTATPGTICLGASVQLAAVASGGSGSYTYSWTSVPAGFTSALANPTVTPTVNTTYHVAVNDGFNTVNSQVGVTVNALPATPTITAGGPTTFCTGGSVTLTSSAGTTYLWSTGATTASINVTAAGSYTVRVTNSNGCQSASSAATVVTVNALPATPTITADGPTTFCTGGSVTLTSSAGTTYLWSTGATTQSINVSSAGSYTVRVTNANGCQSALSAATTVTVNALPVVNAGTDATIPNGTSRTLNATVTGTGPFTYSWTPSSQLVNATVEDPTTLNLTGTTVFTLTATSTATTCSNTDAVTITVSGGALSSVPTATPGTICAGATVQLSAVASGGSGSYTYSWTSLPAGFTSSIANPTVNPSVSTTYYVAVNDGFNTVNSQVGVTVNALPATPTITAGGPTTFCTGGSVTLTSSAGSTYLWSTGATTQSINVTTAGSYTVRVTNASGCQSASSAATAVTVNTLPATPTITAGGPTTFCTGGSVTLTSSAGTSYLWSTGATTASINVTTAGSYTVQVTNASGCQSASSAATSVTVNALPSTPTITAGGPTTFCTGGSVTLISSAGTTYLWSTGATTASINVTTAGSYTVRVTNANSCQSAASAATVVTVNAIPVKPTVGTITHPTCVDPTGSVLLSGLPSPDTWTITGSPGGFTSTGTTPSITVTGLTTGTYTFTVTSSAGCTSASSNNVVLNAQPVTPSAPVVGAITQTTCTISAGSVALSGLPSPGTWTLTRSPGNITTTGSGTTRTITALEAGTYTFTVTNSVGCTSAPSADVVINPQPPTPAIPLIESIVQPTCTVATGGVSFSGLPSTGSWTLTRYPGAIASIGSGSTYTLSGIPVGTFNYTVTNSSGCISSPSANVLINAQPITPTAPVIGTRTHPTCIVPTGSVALSGLPSTGTWVLTSIPAGITKSGTGASTTVSGIDPGTYTLTVTNSVGCTSVPSANLVINPQPSTTPSLIITDPAALCSPSTADLTAASVTAGSTPDLIYTYWTNPAATVPFLTPAIAPDGTYYIKGTSTDGCLSVRPVTVSVLDPPVAFGGEDQVLEYLFETTLDAWSPGAGETGKWSVTSGSGTFEDDTDPKTEVTKLKLGENILLWTVTNGACPPANDYVEITVNPLVIPTLITPNLDGKNDFFVLRGIETLGKTELTIFDRRGAQVYKNADYQNDWDGTNYNSDQLPDDTYFFTIRAENGVSLSGYVVVRR